MTHGLLQLLPSRAKVVPARVGDAQLEVSLADVVGVRHVTQALACHRGEGGGT